MKPFVAAFAVATLVASPALALEVERSVETDAAPEAVWEAVGDFCGIADWHPAVESCEESDSDGTTRRTLTLAGDGGTLVEDLVSRDDEAMTYTYRIVEGPLPVQNYESTISVMAADEGSKLSWKGNFDPAEAATEDQATSVIGGIYDAGLQGIAEAASK